MADGVLKLPMIDAKTPMGHCGEAQQGGRAYQQSKKEEPKMCGF